MALYVYGIMRAGDAGRAIGATQGRKLPALDTVEHDQVSAVVSVIADGALALRRDSIVAHADVLQAAFAHGPVLPLRFGTALPDGAAVVREVLAPASERLRSQLEALESKGEMQLKATYREEPLLRSILAQDRALAQAVQRNRGLPAAATHFEQIRIGEAIAAAVSARQEVDSEALVAALRPTALAVVVSPPHHERAVLNASFLVEQANLGQFDAAVEKLSRERSVDTEFKLIGPLPPYSFVDWRAESGGAQEASATWA